MKNDKWIYLNILIPFIIKIFIPDGRYGTISLSVDFVILPLVLFVLNIVIIIRKIEKSLFKCFFLMLSGLTFGQMIGYLVWGISNNRLFTPDAETIIIVKGIVLYQICATIILFVLAILVVFCYKYSISLLRNKR